MTGVAARAAAGASASASRQTSESSRERRGIAREGSEGGAGTRGIGGPRRPLKSRKPPPGFRGASDLDRMEKSGPPISDRVTVCGPPAPPYRSHPVQAAGGGILRSLARRRRVPSSITTYRRPVTRTSPAGVWWPRPRKGGLGHRPGGSGVAAQREQRDVVLALLGQRIDDLVREALDVRAVAAGERREALEPVVEAPR